MTISVNPDWWKRLFDDIYLATDARSVCNPRITRREVDLVCHLLNPSRHDRILDLCGGQGRHLFELYRRGYRNVTLADYSATLTTKALEHARRLNCGIGVLRCDARHTGLSENRFDHVLILGNSLGYLLEPAADLTIIREALRVLRPEGRLLIDVTNGASVKENFTPSAWHEVDPDIIVCRQRELRGDMVNAREIVLSRKKGLIREETYRLNLYDATSLEKLLKKAGFEDACIHARFSPHAQAGDYGFMNDRLIATATKP
jgi:D-alanine-D-alanine ligase